MVDEEQVLRIVVGLTRRSINLLEGVGRTASAARLASVVEELLDTNPCLRGTEMSPESACLAMGIPLGGELSPALAEVDPPVDLELAPQSGARPALVWPPGH